MLESGRLHVLMPVTVCTVALLGCAANSSPNGATSASHSLVERPSIDDAKKAPPEVFTTLAAFGRAYAAVRYFYPDSSIAQEEWRAVLAESVRTILRKRGGRTPARLIASLFRGVAPHVRVFETRSSTESFCDTDSTGAEPLTWRHTGLGPSAGGGELFESRLASARQHENSESVTLFQLHEFDVEKKAAIKGGGTFAAAPGSDVVVFLEELREGESLGEGSRVARPPSPNGETAVEMELGAGSRRVALGMTLKGKGMVRLKRASLRWNERELIENRSFELSQSGDKRPYSWDVQATTDAFSVRQVAAPNCSGAPHCLEVERSGFWEDYVSSRPTARVNVAENIEVCFPLTLKDGTPEVSANSGRRDVRWDFSAEWARLSVVIIAWAVLEQFYPYASFASQDTHDVLEAALKRAATATDKSETVSVLRWLLVQYGDGHGEISHEQLDISHEMPLLWEWLDDRLVITQVESNVAGVAVGDVVERVNGRDVRAFIRDEERYVAGATPAFRRYWTLRNLRLGPEGDAMVLSLKSPKGVKKQAQVKRSVPRTPGRGRREDRGLGVREMEPGIWYVDLDRVGVEEWERALPALSRATGIVFDMRGYPRMSVKTVPGHLSDDALLSPIFEIPVRVAPNVGAGTVRDLQWVFWPRKPHISAKAVFLVDERAVSAAETLLTVVKYYKLGKLVGEPTGATNGNVNDFELPGGLRMRWTGVAARNHDGSRHYGIGVLPDIHVSRSVADVQAGRDSVLAKGLSVLKTDLKHREVP